MLPLGERPRSVTGTKIQQTHKIQRDLQKRMHTLSNTLEQFFEIIIMIEVVAFHLERSGMAFSSALAFKSFLLVAEVRTRSGPLQKCQSHSCWISRSISFMSLALQFA